MCSRESEDEVCRQFDVIQVLFRTFCLFLHIDKQISQEIMDKAKMKIVVGGSALLRDEYYYRIRGPRRLQFDVISEGTSI